MTKSIIKKQILWKAEYVVKIEAIDIEHQKLFNLAQQCLENNEANNNQDKLKKNII